MTEVLTELFHNDGVFLAAYTAFVIAAVGFTITALSGD